MDRNDHIKEVLAPQMEDNEVLVHWCLIAKVASQDSMTTVVHTCDDMLDIVTHLGLGRALAMRAEDRYNGKIEPDD